MSTLGEKFEELLRRESELQNQILDLNAERVEIDRKLRLAQRELGEIQKELDAVGDELWKERDRERRAQVA